MAARMIRKKRKIENSDSGVPFARGFYLPTPKQSRNAIGLSPIPTIFEPGPENSHFQNIPSPRCQDDSSWLAQYDEKGQSFKSFVRSNPWISGRRVKYTKQKFIPDGKNLKVRYPEGKIYIQPLGNFNQSINSDGSPCVHDLADYTERFYALPVVVLPEIKLNLPAKKGSVIFWQHDPSHSLEENKTRSSSRVQSKKQQLNHRSSHGHIQLKVNSIHALLRQLIPDDALCLISLTMVDLYEEDTDLFVAGLASGNQRVAVFSFARYDPCLSFSTEHWYNIWPSKKIAPKQRKKMVLQRSCKLLVHEIAHLMGVDHCIWYSCCMNGAGHLSEDFAQPIYLCPVDLHKLQHLCGFDIVDRYRKLLEFFKKHDMKEEAQWFQSRLNFIDNKG